MIPIARVPDATCHQLIVVNEKIFVLHIEVIVQKHQEFALRPVYHPLGKNASTSRP